MNTHRSSMSRGSAADCATPCDEDLLIRVAGGDTAAFAELYDRLATRVFGLCRAILHDHPGYAGNTARAALVELWCTAPRYDPAHASARNWTLTLAHRHAVAQLRNLRASAHRETRLVAHDDTPSYGRVADTDVARAENQRLYAQLAVLTTCQREAITLIYYRGHTYGDTAALLGLPVGKLPALLRTGLHRLREAGDTSDSDGANTTARAAF